MLYIINYQNIVWKTGIDSNKKGTDCRFSGDLQLKRKTDDRQIGFVRLGLHSTWPKFSVTHIISDYFNQQAMSLKPFWQKMQLS